AVVLTLSPADMRDSSHHARAALGLSRRGFLGWLATLPVASTIVGCIKPTTESSRALDDSTLVSLGASVLPSELGESGVRGAVSRFQAWVNGYAPGAELNHGYGTAEIKRTPPDP